MVEGAAAKLTIAELIDSRCFVLYLNEVGFYREQRQFWSFGINHSQRHFA